MPKDDKNMESVILRYLRGGATDEEAANVELWMEASPDHGQLIERLCFIYFACETLQCMQHAKAERSLEKVKQKLRDKNCVVYIVILKFHQYITY